MIKINGRLHVHMGKKGPTFFVTFTNNKGKEVKMPVPASACCFDRDKATEGDPVWMECNGSGQITACGLPGQEAEPPRMRPGRTAPDDRRERRQSQAVSSTGNSLEKAATAPYNFIPYVHEAVLPPFADDQEGELWSGVIRCRLEALTSLLVAGPHNREKDGGERRFLTVDGKPVIPGSSLKGMIRALVEVLSFSYLRPLNEAPIFWRQPDAPEYRARFSTQDGAPILGGYLRKRGASYTLTQVRVERVLRGEAGRGDEEIIETGFMPGKKYNYRFSRSENEAHAVANAVHAVAPDVVNNFLLQLTPFQKNIWKKDRLDKDGHPVFFRVDENGEIAEIGLCRYFRLKYRHVPGDACRHQDAADFASRLFGTARGEARKGRVAFESAVVEGREEHLGATVLGQPSAACLAHYVKQEPARRETPSHGKGKKSRRLASYDQDDFRLRGRKWYWHRDVAIIPPPNDNGKNPSYLHPLQKGATAEFAVRVDRVTRLELGALLEALELPPDHAHKLGLGKSLGLGSVRIVVEQAHIGPTARRYGLFAERCAPRPELSPADRLILRREFQSAVASAVQARYPAWKGLSYEELPPVKALRAMMDYGHRPPNSATAPMKLKDFQRKALLRAPLDVYRARDEG